MEEQFFYVVVDAVTGLLKESMPTGAKGRLVFTPTKMAVQDSRILIPKPVEVLFTGTPVPVQLQHPSAWTPEFQWHLTIDFGRPESFLFETPPVNEVVFLSELVRLPAINIDGTPISALRGPKGDDGAPGDPGAILTGVGAPSMPDPQPGVGYLDTATGDLYVFTAEGEWELTGNLRGPQGNPGPSNSLTIGTVVVGTTASAEIVGESPTQQLNLTIPQAEAGNDGADATVEIAWQGTQLVVNGEVGPDLQGPQGNDAPRPEILWQGTQLSVDGQISPDLKGEPGPDGTDGTSPELTWQGTSLAVDGVAGPDLKGEPGDNGDTPVLSWQGTALVVDGVTGPDLKGEKGDPGNDSTVPGPANNIGIGTVSTGAVGSSAVATVTGAYPDQKLNLTIPRGDKGADGTSPTITTAALNTPGLLNAVFIETGGTIPPLTPPWALVIELDA